MKLRKIAKHSSDLWGGDGGRTQFFFGGGEQMARLPPPQVPPLPFCLELPLKNF